MITSADLSAMLFAVSTGFPDRALNIIETSEHLDDDLRKRLFEAVKAEPTSEGQARGIGDLLLAAEAEQVLVNECYRAAFYLGPHWTEMARNPLYAHFLANRAHAVLDKWIHYFPIYHRHLERFRGRPIRLLEVGVYRGGGLDLWQSYLGVQAHIVGTDIDETAQRSVMGRFTVAVGDQADADFLRRLNDQHGPFDVIIDDGGHTMEQQITTVETLFPLLNDEGVFIVEDCHTSYWPDYGGGLDEAGSFIEWTKRRIDDLHARYATAVDQSSVWAQHVDGMHVHDSVVVLDKKRRFRPFNEMTGTSTYLMSPRYSELVAVELVGTRDAVSRERDQLVERVAAYEGRAVDDVAAGAERPVADTEELRLARAELDDARAQLASAGGQLDVTTRELDQTRNELLESWEHIRQIRRSLSWRLTGPLRAARRVRRS